MSILDEIVEQVVTEKAVSQAQQKFMGMVYAYKNGDMKKASPAIKKAAESMSDKEVKDFASTKHKELPLKKEQAYKWEPLTENNMKLESRISELSYDTTFMGANVLPPNYGNSKLNIVAEEVYGKKYLELTDELQEKILDLFRDPSALKENKINTKTESIVKRLKEDSEYQKFFKSAMDKFGVKSPKSLSDKKKKEFFNYVDKNYKAKSE